MTLETYWIFGKNKIDQKNDPLIVKWIEKLGLLQEKIIIKRETIEGYARITLTYYEDSDTWVIGLPMIFGINHAIHKLGYIWVWRNTGILPIVKQNWKKQTKIIFNAESCILDNIVFYNFCNMDKEFRVFLLDFLVKELVHFYNGASWNKDLPGMIYTYIVNYLAWLYILPQKLQNKFSNYIMYNLIKRKEEILEKAELLLTNYSKKDFRRLHKLLRQFDQILKVKGYLAIQTYINQILFYFPLV